MTVEHKNIVEAQLHECKGASTAGAGAILQADGAGSADWIQKHGLWCYRINPISFTAGAWADLDWDGTLLSNGITRSGATLTIARDGHYIVSYGMIGPSPAKAEIRVLKNSSELDGSARGLEASSSVQSLPLNATFGAELLAGDTLKVQLYVHTPSSGSFGYISGGVANVKGVAQFYVYNL